MLRILLLVLTLCGSITLAAQLNYAVQWPLLKSAAEVDSNVAVYKKQHVSVVVDSVFFKPDGKERILEKLHKSFLDDDGRVLRFESKDLSSVSREIWKYDYNKTGFVTAVSYMRLKDEDTISNWRCQALKYDDLRRPLLLHKQWLGRYRQTKPQPKIVYKLLWDYVGTEAAKQYPDEAFTDTYTMYEYFPAGGFSITDISLAGKDTLSVNSEIYSADGGFLERIYTFYAPGGRKGTIVWKDINLKITLTETITWRGDSVFEYTTYYGNPDEFSGGVKAYRKENSDSTLWCTFIFKSGQMVIQRPATDEVSTSEIWQFWEPRKTSNAKREKPLSVIRIPLENGIVSISYVYQQEDRTYTVLLNSKGMRVFYKKKNTEMMRRYLYRDTKMGRANSKEPVFTIFTRPESATD
ncbi:MAG: hypothetical protein MUC87_01470 [Bacteroidia bacterium]|jgi:hypothetical protein|nr:hypothetical protein [Bacteroidia bacterium]